MEFISNENGLNCHVISSFMEIFMKVKQIKNEKWIKILDDFWNTIKNTPLEEMNDESWYQLGNLIESNLIEDWKNDICEIMIMRSYIYHHSRQYTKMDYPESFEKYDDYFQETDRLEYEYGNYDSDEERAKTLEQIVDYYEQL